MSTSEELKKIVTVARPVIERWLDLVEELAAIRDAATQKGLDWGQIKALLKAQAQDERDEKGGSKRVTRIIEKADYAASYADMLGLGLGNMNKMNEQNSISGDSAADPLSIPADLSIPPYLRRQPAEAV
jgi:hypothetical protein